MNLEIHLIVWKELREHFRGPELEEAAEDFARVLIEHGADANDFLVFSIPSEVKSALKEYIEVEDDEDEFMDEYEDEEYI